MLKNSIFLYSGYLTKSQGQICWHPKLPSFNETSSQFDEGICITNCIHDPFPYTQGGKDSILEVINPFIVIDESDKKMDDDDKAHAEMLKSHNAGEL
jgi:hypothetical protein